MDVKRTSVWLRIIQALQPPGAALPTSPAANFTKLLEAAAAMLGDSEQQFDEWFAQYDPLQATTMLTDWERLLGLPDCCDAGTTRTLPQRRLDVLEKLTMLGGQSRQFFIDLMARRGIVITIDELGNYVWRVNAPMVNEHFFEVGTAVAGDPLRTWGDSSMECRIGRLKPAHTRVLFGYA
ncbi:MAG: DUF2313 domain-containing protein [Burkholderiales bacterium]|nr:DUF2313 domain-containing protein [Burkholderiales bacterium]